jgi:uncharacterized integral membrane protein
VKIAAPVRFSYTTSRSGIVGGILVLIVIAVFLVSAAASGREFTFRGGLRVPSGVLKLMAAFMTAVCIYVLVGARRLWRRKNLQFVELTQTGIVVPRAGLNGGVLAVPYADILNVSQIEIAGRTLLVITSRVGESRLISSDFKSFGDFTQFYSSLQAARLANKSLERTRGR